MRKLLPALLLFLCAGIAHAQTQVPIVNGVATLDTTQSQSFKIIVTQQINSVVLTNPGSQGNRQIVVNILFAQDATGYAVIFGGNLLNAPAIATAANSVTQVSTQFDSNTNTWVFLSTGGAAPPGGFPRLDQVLNPNVSKSFNLGGSFLAFTNGALDFTNATSLALPVAGSCVASANGQICFDSTALNWHLWSGADQFLATFPVASPPTSGDVSGFLLNAGQWTMQDLGPVNTLTGQSFLNLNMTTPIDGDIPCFDSTGPPYWNNCTAGTVATVISGATSTYTFALTDNQTIIEHDSAGSASVTGTLPTANTLGFPAMGFIYSNHSTHADSIAPTTWTINGSATLAVAANTFCRVYVDTNSTTNWLTDCATTGGGSGTLSGTLTAGKVPVASAPTVLVDGSILDDGTHAARDNAGYDVNSLGAYIYWVANAASIGTTVNKMVCDDGAGKGVICNHTTSTTNDPLGVAVVANGAAPGTTGSTGVCNIGFCTVVMDNSATANHYAQQSTSVDGDLSDVGTTQPTNGQPYWHIFSSNAGAGTTAVFRNMDSSELNATSGGGGKSTSVQVNGTGTKNIANLVNGTGITFAVVNSGNTTTITPTVTGGGGGSWSAITSGANSNTGLFSLSQGGTFTNVAAANDTFDVLINSIVPATEFADVTASGWSITSGLTGGVAVPGGSSMTGWGSGVSGYANTSSATTEAVGVSAQCRSLVAGAKCWSFNGNSATTSGHVASLIGIEQDMITLNTGDTGWGILLKGSFVAQPTSGMVGVAIDQPNFAIASGTPGATVHYNTGFQCITASVLTGDCFDAEPSATGNSKDSSKLSLYSSNSGGTKGGFSLNSTFGSSTALVLTDNAASTTSLSFGSGNVLNFSNPIGVPAGVAFTAPATGELGVDSSNNNLHVGLSAADAIIPTTTTTPTNGNCVQWSVAGGRQKLADSGAGCGGGGGSGTVSNCTTAHSLSVYSATGTTVNCPNGPGTSGQVLTSNGASSDPTFQTISGGLSVASVTLNSTNLATIGATPIQIIAAPGAGIATVVLGCFAQYKFATAPYTITNAAGLDLAYAGNVSNAKGLCWFPATGLVDQGASQITFGNLGNAAAVQGGGSPPILAQTAVANTAVNFGANGGTMTLTGGSGTLTITVYYTTLTLQ